MSPPNRSPRSTSNRHRYRSGHRCGGGFGISVERLIGAPAPVAAGRAPRMRAGSQTVADEVLAHRVIEGDGILEVRVVPGSPDHLMVPDGDRKSTRLNS